MDPGGKIARLWGNKAAIEDTRSKVLGVFDWKVEGVEGLHKPGFREG